MSCVQMCVKLCACVCVRVIYLPLSRLASSMQIPLINIIIISVDIYIIKTARRTKFFSKLRLSFCYVFYFVASTAYHLTGYSHCI